MPDAISLKRITLLIRKGFPTIRNTALVLLLMLFVLLILRAESFYSYLENEKFIGMMFQIYLSIGSILASKAFIEIYDKHENYSWFMLPASALEKFIAQLLLTTFIYITFLMVGFYLVTLAADTLGQYLYAHKLGVFRPWGSKELLMISGYAFYHSLFFLGAAYFRKHVFLKTTAVAILTFAILFSLAIFLLHRIYPETISTGQGTNFTIFKTYGTYIQWFIYGILPLILWYFAYIRIKRVEVSHGI